MIKNTFKNADEAYKYFFREILKNGTPFANTKALFNIGFTIENPLNNHIHDKGSIVPRKWNAEYAEAEWQWYLSGDRNIDKLGELYGKTPEIWKRMADEDGNVNSNYGWQWQRNIEGTNLNQIEWVVKLLKQYPITRQAAISIFDGKETKNYAKDTPCTYAVQFTILNDKLNMCVTMRSNDLWYGFCNDQYCFSELQALVAERLNIPIGTYYHFAHNLHLYNDKIPKPHL
ncbi:thymidylate synthase [bacterium]|nr:thymidylate synthase [bacterium]